MTTREFNPEEYFQFNINDYVRVKITEFGKKVWSDCYTDILDKLPADMREDYMLKIQRDKEGYSEFQMHELMRIFGASMPSFSPVPFETTVFIKKSELHEVEKSEE